ncbi:hypothetical protein M3D71_002715 [Micrococcus luteus]|uniref:hypothetical protein n=1 Tax=Micrococcus luteus TaxID=1270 RepID=UPI000763AB2D|nr:hypothetical protein [Micrococcus luteus]KWW38877.1 Chromosome partition protein Smc [Micrococcus luteus]MCV7510643.1 hypothetical protein [Micrococcus luteus]MCV7519737.1 hypothetical protein [Micrococcus luteus]MCV7571893.1 hypothetical protein [Micrococcus luteus]MCV7623490.1 hypothetical protein [Micrococcus luteus]
MPQPIAVGAVLGGRYRITQHVVTSADQDMVFLGTDQVLNRRVTVLVASRENATQVASSARELATGERTDDVQVLDLGLSEGRTYLIAGGDPDPDVLLGLAYPQELYVEPFQTDSLGSELFGESRTQDPHAYDDDEAYYTDLDRRLRADEDEAQRRPGFLNRLSERLAERVRPSDGTAAKAAAGASALAAADAATRKQQEERERAEREAAERAERERKEAAERAERERKEAEEKARAEREAAERAERERKEAAERAERERREAEERAEEERRAEAERARRQAEQEAEDRAAREREAEQARLAAEREEAERRELERRAEARRRAEEEQAREAQRREAEKREAAEREAEKRAAAERAAQKHDTQAGTAALPAVAAGAAAAQAPNADADGTTPPTEPVEPVAAEKTDPPEPVAPDTEAIPVRRQRPVPRRAIAAESAPTVREESRGTAAPVAAAAGAATAAGAAAAGSTAAAAAPDAQAAPATTGGGDGATVADPGDGNGRTRGGGPLALLLVVGLLAALVVGGVLLAQNLRGGPAPQAAAASSGPASSGSASSESASSGSASDTPSPSESTSPSPTSTSESATAAPTAVQALRSVPDLPEHEAEHDADLPNLIDGDPTTVWRTFAYARPNFGGYVESMNLVVQLEDRTEVNEVTLQSTGATGGAWFAYIADSPEGANAKEIGNGTFDQDTVSIPVPFEGAESEAEYVIVSLTSLPQLEGTTPDLPFGLRLGEITVR